MIDRIKNIAGNLRDNILTRLIESIKERKLLIKLYDNISTPIPVANGNVITITKDNSSDTLDKLLPVIKWYGAACYQIRFGDALLLTDPFITYLNLIDVIKPIKSDPELINTVFNPIENIPDAVFIGHSHYDHMLDTVAALELKEHWNNVPIYGSKTTKNILAGNKKSRHPDSSWSQNCKIVDDSSADWNEIKQPNGNSAGLYYKSYVAEHAPHACIGQISITVWKGTQKDPRTSPAEFVNDYRSGKTYIYLFKFTENEDDSLKEFTIALVGAATRIPDPFHNEPIDVLILCVPGSQHYREYPMNLIKALNPRVIILSHFDDFFKKRRTDFMEKGTDFKMFTIPTSNFYSFLYKIQLEIENSNQLNSFEKIIIPGIGAEMNF